MGAGRQASQEEVNSLIQAVDSNNDGKIAKPELYEIFKRVVSGNWLSYRKFNQISNNIYNKIILIPSILYSKYFLLIFYLSHDIKYIYYQWIIIFE